MREWDTGEQEVGKGQVTAGHVRMEGSETKRELIRSPFLHCTFKAGLLPRLAVLYKLY